MKTYLIRTTTTMKEYNNRKWWIDPNIIREKNIEAENITEAMKKYRESVQENDFVEISNNAMKNKQPMYIDTPEGAKQTGYVITGKTDFEDRDTYRSTQQYIDLWISVNVIESAF